MKQLMIRVLLTFFVINCSEGETEVPNVKTQNIPTGAIISISSLKAGIDRFVEEQTISFFEEDQFIEGFVISSDKEGNFFKEIIIQDEPENPTAGISILIDERALYQRYPLGSKIRIRLQGLSMGFKNGVLQLGVLKEKEITSIDFSSVDDHIFRTAIQNDLKPIELTIEQITRDHELLYVLFNNIQFEKSLIAPINKTIAGELSDNFDGLRIIQQCPSSLELVMCTSTFSSFKNTSIPINSGKISGVLTRDFRDDFFVIKMNSITDLNFEQEDRCESVFFDCPSNGKNANAIIFQEDFEEITNEIKLEPLGWYNINVTGDEKRWEDRKVTNVDNRTLTISAFNSNLRPLEAWLITPEIDLTNIESATMSVRVRTRFNNGKTLKIWITNSYSGDPLTTNWMLLPVDIPVESSNFRTLQQNISCAVGKVRIAFQYKGFDPVITSTYEIDDLKIYSTIK